MRRILLIGLAVLGLAGTAAWAASPVLPIGPNDPVLGSASAPVTVIEYASLTCPHCAHWEDDVFPQVKKNLIDTGKIRYAYRDFPLDGAAIKAAQLAHCEPARFYGFIQVLFQGQASWASNDPTEALGKVARLGGISADKFQQCMDDKALLNSVVVSRQQGEEAGVDSTPTFFFNGKRVAGAISYDDFVAAVKDASP
jgi:protein-disulfide isomerase